MTLQYDVRLTPATGEAAIFEFKRFMKTLGWTVPKSSDGITYNATGDQITGSGTGAGGLGNVRSWFVLRQPTISTGNYAQPSGGVREFLFQHAATAGDGVNWFISYTSKVPFADGTVIPVAAASLTDVDFFSIGDGTTTKAYEFDTNGSVTPGRIGVVITSGMSAGAVAAAMVTAINGGGQNVTAYQLISGVTAEVSIQKTGGGPLTSLTETVANAGFTVSIPTATIRPNASGAGFVLGGGTIATPTYVPLFPANGTYRWNIVADNATPYGFCGYGWISGGSADGPALLYDPMQDTTFIPASPGPGDYDPYICYAGYSAAGSGAWAPANGNVSSIGCSSAAPGSPGGTAPYGHTHTGQPDDTWGIIAICMPGTSLPTQLVADSSNPSAQNAGQNPWSGKDILIDVPYIRSTLVGSPTGLKGFSSFVKINMSAARTRGLLFDDVNPGDYVSVGGVGLPWDQGPALV